MLVKSQSVWSNEYVEQCLVCGEYTLLAVGLRSHDVIFFFFFGQ